MNEGEGEKVSTIELCERELKLLEAIIDNMEEIHLKEGLVYRIRNIFVVLYSYFEKLNSAITRQAIRYSVDKLEEVGLLKKVAKTKSNGDKGEKDVYELQLERFDKSRIVQIKNRYGNRKKKGGEAKDLPNLRIKPSWFKLEPLDIPTSPADILKKAILQRRDKILEEIARLEGLLAQQKEALKKADDAIAHAQEAARFLEIKNVDYMSQKDEDTTGKNELMLLPREDTVLQGIIGYLKEKGGDEVKGIKNTLAEYFASKGRKISKATIFHAAKGLVEVGLLEVETGMNRGEPFIYKLNRKLFDNSRVIVKEGLLRNSVSPTIRIKKSI